MRHILQRKERTRTWPRLTVLAAVLSLVYTFPASAQRAGDGAVQFPGQSVDLAQSVHKPEAVCSTMDQGSSTRSPSSMLSTAMYFNNSGFGIMFDVEAVVNLEVESLDANLGAAADHDIQVFFKSGSHVGFEHNPAAWTFVGSANDVSSNGEDTLTAIPVEMNVTIAGGHTAAFYIAVTSAVPNPIGHPSHLLYSNGTVLNTVFASDSNLMVKEGTALGVPSVQPFQGGLYQPRQYSGAVHYALCGGFDDEAPLLECLPTGAITNCYEAYDPSMTGMPSVSDNIDFYPFVYWEDVIETTGECPVVTTITRTFYAEDLCGNLNSCVQVIEVHDEQPPIMDCPGDLTVDVTESSSPPATGMLYTYDECSMQPFIAWDDVSLSVNECIVVDVIERTWTSIDECGNDAHCIQSITIAALSTPPVLDCPEQIVILCSQLQGLEDIVEANDCGTVDLAFTDLEATTTGSCAGEMTILRTWTATDEQGNASSCNQTIQTFDDEPPEVTFCGTTDPIICSDNVKIDFSDLDPWDVITQVVVGGLEIDITAYSKGSIIQDAVVFDTGDPSVADLDLGTPNTYYGGEGVSILTPDGYELSNNRSVGHALVVQNPMSLGYPDDYFLSDSIIFEFSEPVFLESLTLVDLEEPQALFGAGAFMWNENGSLVDFIGFSGGPDNSIEDVCLMTPGVTRLAVYFGSVIPASGAVSGLSFIPLDSSINAVDFADACGSVVAMTQDIAFDLMACSATVVRSITAIDDCGNTSTDTCIQLTPMLVDFMSPEIIPPQDISIGCDDPLPAPDVNGVLVLDNQAASPDITVEYVEDISEGIGCLEVTRRVYSATDPCGNTALGVQHIYRAPAVHVDAKVFLLGALDASDSAMVASLNGLLPFVQPYLLIYGYPGLEVAPFLGPDVVDWVLLELRDPDSGLVVAQRAGLLLTNGDVVDLDGTSDVIMFAEPASYFLSLRHRNHLDIISTDPIDFSSGSGSCDFTNGAAAVAGMYALPDGQYAMLNGDVNADQLIKYNGSGNDKNGVLGIVGLNSPNSVVPGYLPADINFDGQVRYNGSGNDKNVLLEQVGLTTPNHVIVGQLYE